MCYLPVKHIDATDDIKQPFSGKGSSFMDLSVIHSLTSVVRRAMSTMVESGSRVVGGVILDRALMNQYVNSYVQQQRVPSYTRA